MLKSDNLLDDCDLDPNINFFNCLATVRNKYYLEDQLSLVIVHKGFTSNVKLLHLKIRGFAKNSDAVFNYLSNISTKFHFIALTETCTNVVYRLPAQVLSKFISEFEVLLQILSKEKNTSYICGDFNINWLNYDIHLLTQSYLDLLLSFRPLINMPTRITETSCTLIDNIFTNDLSN